MLLKATTFFTALYQVTKAGLVTLIQKQNNRGWNGITHLPRKKNIKTVPSNNKTIRTRFWDAEGCILIKFLAQGQAMNAACYFQTLLRLRCALQVRCPGKKKTILQLDMHIHTASMHEEDS
jgi:hypothetical protein